MEWLDKGSGLGQGRFVASRKRKLDPEIVLGHDVGLGVRNVVRFFGKVFRFLSALVVDI